MSLTKISAVALIAVSALMGAAALADTAPAFVVDPAIASLSPEQKVAAREAAMKEDGRILQKVSEAGAVADSIPSIDKAIQNFTNFPAWFSEDTKDIKSFALPTVWQQFDKFTAEFADGAKVLLAMRQAAQDGDDAAFADAMDGMDKVCGGCHQDFRASLH